MWELMEDLQDMGENNAIIGRFVMVIFVGDECSSDSVILDVHLYIATL